ncbi:MAG: SpoIIE family protein phosphatase [Leptospirales bacterium]|nr:SpoIIE family protein phosphatase [Leptospirales bacterium]
MIQRNPDRRRFKADFIESLHGQARILHWPAALVSLIAWLGFALDTDKKLHPDFPELFYFRITLSIISLLMLLAIVLEKITSIRFRGKGLGWMYALYGYVLLSCAFFTGRIADDPNYVSGLQVVVMLTVFIPFSLLGSYILYFLSIALFVASIALFGPRLGTDAAQYSMQNIAIAYILSFIMSVVLDHYRFHMFNNHRKIIEQGREVRERMDEVVKLKEKQDGDYFLTSLLIKPLIANSAPRHPVDIEFLLDQHKKFIFRNRESEIGGDYLCAHAVELQGKPFTAFINGDAMGKSIQGAGGALVLGTVFQSVIQRTHSSRDSQKPPEVWLKDCFVDLHNVFTTFDGSMLVSALLGILDNETGLLYYINAEHPRIVLYRNREAKLVEDEHILRKLGVTGITQGMRIRTLQLEPQDILVIGSDGRDDLEIGVQESGTRIMNEDENLFRAIVQNAGGDLAQIKTELQKAGHIVDDLSLMRLGYREDESAERLNDIGKAIEKAGQLARSLSAETDLTGSWKAYREYVELNPCDTEAIHTTAYLSKLLYRKNRDPALLAFGIAQAERIRLRDPANVKNLINLADLCRLTGNRDRALKILAEAERTDKSNPRLADLRDLLAAR